MKKCICDIETDGVENCQHIWCCVCRDVDTDLVTVFREGDADKCREYFAGYDRVIGHNFISFDRYWLKKLWKVVIPVENIIDTLVLSRLADSSRKAHSLRDWGERLGVYKDHNEDWTHWTQEMEDYCIQDVNVNLAVYRQLQKDLRGFTRESIELEQFSQYLLSLQKKHGFKLNRDLAIKVKTEIDNRYFEIISKLKELFPPRKIKKYDEKLWVIKRNKAGEPNAVSQRILDSGLLEPVSTDTYRRFSYIWKEFSIDSPSEIVERLKDYWKPFIFTPAGQPKVCEENLNTLREDAPNELKLIKECKVLKSRSTLIQSYFDACDDNDRVHGDVLSIGTATHRMAHRNPNTGNIPSKGLYGEVCREMFTVEEGRLLVGCDASNIQLRGLCHYMKDDNLRYNIVHKDMHYYFSTLYGLNPANKEYDESNHDMVMGRKKGKTCTFAIIMGAGVAKIGQILGGYDKGLAAFAGLKKNCKGWNKFQQELEYRAKIGFFTGLDGRKIPIKSAHFAMSTYLQAYEAVCMKWAMVQAYKRIKEAGLDAYQVAVVHDEMQWDCKAEDAEKVGVILRQCIRDAGTHFNSFCPLEGEYKIGKSWIDTH
jgi:hypothetical protein